MPYCPNCDIQYPDGYNICSECAGQLTVNPANHSSQSPAHKCYRPPIQGFVMEWDGTVTQSTPSPTTTGASLPLRSDKSVYSSSMKRKLWECIVATWGIVWSAYLILGLVIDITTFHQQKALFSQLIQLEGYLVSLPYIFLPVLLIVTCIYRLRGKDLPQERPLFGISCIAFLWIILNQIFRYSIVYFIPVDGSTVTPLSILWQEPTKSWIIVDWAVQLAQWGIAFFYFSSYFKAKKNVLQRLAILFCWATLVLIAVDQYSPNSACGFVGAWRIATYATLGLLMFHGYPTER